MPRDEDLQRFAGELVSSSKGDAGFLLLERLDLLPAFCKRLGHLFELRMRTIIINNANGVPVFRYFDSELGMKELLALEVLSRTVPL